MLSPKGSTRSKWEYEFKGDGLRKISLSDVGASLQIRIKAKRWFSAAAANEPAATTRLIITLGNQCFAHGVTKKIP